MRHLYDMLPIHPSSTTSVVQIMLCGVEKCGKTSVAFRLAYEEACKGGTPLFISRAMETFPNSLTIANSSEYEGLRYSNDLSSLKSGFLPEGLNRIKMKYVNSHKDLLELFTGLHCFQPAPSMIIIDDFDVVAEIGWENNLLTSQQKSSGPQMRDKKFESCFFMNAFLQDSIHFMSVMDTQQTLKKVVLVFRDRDSDIQTLFMKFSAIQYKLHILPSRFTAEEHLVKWQGRGMDGGERDIGRLKKLTDSGGSVFIIS